MIISMYRRFIAVTNRYLCLEEQYFAQIEKIVGLHPDSVILREKDLTDEEYSVFAKKVKQICDTEGIALYLHSQVKTALMLGCEAIHFSIPKLRENKNNLSHFSQISVSCHSIEDALEAQNAGATRIILGNIFETDCKKGLPGKGLDFLKEIVEQVDIPVYAIGGITRENIEEVIKTGAAGGCMMSGFMKW